MLNTISYSFFWLEPKEPKVQGKHEASGRFAKPTHNNLPKYLVTVIQLKLIACAQSQLFQNADE
jgi:hypothetical protein